MSECGGGQTTQTASHDHNVLARWNEKKGEREVIGKRKRQTTMNNESDGRRRETYMTEMKTDADADIS